MNSVAQTIAFVLIAAVTTMGNILVSESDTAGVPETSIQSEQAVTPDEPSKESTEEALPETDGVFSIAVIPDTQQEVVNTYAIENKHFQSRTEWLVENMEELDLRCVIHTGDVVNWGNEEPKQLEIASEAMVVLAEANIPTAICLGNHDTAAVGVGGSAADPSNTRVRVRDTTAFNEYFSVDTYDYLVSRDDDRIENSYLRFEAEGTKWLVITLELWPRDEIITWAENQIKNRPEYNVIIATHSYLNGDGSISQSNGGYGATSPGHLYDSLIKKYPNIKLVLSGHTGKSAVREDVGENGNKIVSLLGCFHSNEKNPVKIVNIDVESGKIYGCVFSPIDEDRWEEFDFDVSGLEFIKAK